MRLAGALVAVATLCVVSFAPPKALAAACQTPATDYGSVTSTVNIPAAATYRVWSRLMVPSTTNNTYLLEIDGSQCYNVGGTGIAANTWTWVAHKDGNLTTKIDVVLSQGAHTIKMIGNKPDVKLDRLVFSSDLACVPSNDGTNCNVSADSTPPTVRITSPLSGDSVSGTITVQVDATDNTAVSRVELYVNSLLLGTDTSSPYTFSWDTSTAPNDLQALTAKAFDAAGNVGNDSFKVLVQNGDKQAPATPTGLQASAPAYNKVVLNWQASTDNVGVAGYTILRDTVPLANVTNGTTYTDTPVSANSKYSYQVSAYDAAGNKSANSAAVSVTTPNVADTQAPTAPQELTGNSPGPHQIDLNWQASTDNIGVVAYDIYRSRGTGKAQKIVTVTTPNYGDNNLRQATQYRYYIVAKDGAGNSSDPSKTIQVTTLQVTKRGAVTGVIQDSKTSKPIAHASAVVLVGGSKHIYQANRNGEYTIRSLDPLTYTVSYRAHGYHSKTLSVKVDGAVVAKNVALDKK